MYAEREATTPFKSRRSIQERSAALPREATGARGAKGREAPDAPRYNQFATTPDTVEELSSQAFFPDTHSTGGRPADTPGVPGTGGVDPRATSSTTAVRLSGATPRDLTSTVPLP